MIQTYSPGLTFPSRRTLATSTIPSLVHDLLQEFIANVGESPISMTSDGWSTVIGGVSLVSLTAQYLDKNWELREAVLAARELKGKHDAKAISSLLSSILASFSLNHVTAAVTDGAPVMAAACRIMGIKNLHCFAHLLHLSVLDAVKTSAQGKDLISRLQKAASVLHRSSPARAQLAKELLDRGEPIKNLPRDCPTRWGSMFIQLTAANDKMVQSLNAMASTLGITPFSKQDLRLMKNLKTVLGWCYEAQLDVCRSSSLISETIPIVAALKQRLECAKEHFSGESSSFAESLHSALSKRFGRLCEDSVVRDALLLDPRFSLLPTLFDDAEWKKMVDDFLRRHGKESVSNSDDGASDGSDDEEESDSGASRPSLPLFTGSILSTVALPPKITTKKSSEASKSTLESEWEECERLLKYPGNRPSMADGPYAFWRQNVSRLPLLSALVRRFLVIPSTSVSSERLFSKATYIYRNTCRARLTGARAEECLLYSANCIPKNKLKELAVERIKSRRLLPVSEDQLHAEKGEEEENNEEDFVDGDGDDEDDDRWWLTNGAIGRYRR